MVYTEAEVERIAINAFDLAMKRDRKLCSVDKANVLEVSQLWREARAHAHAPRMCLLAFPRGVFRRFV